MLSFLAIDRTLDRIYDAHSQACNVDASRHDMWLGLIDAVSLTTADSVRKLNVRYFSFDGKE